MINELKLYMVMIGCRPKGRFTEQHDIFFGIGSSLADLVPEMRRFWPEAKGRFHIDVWREVTQVDGFNIQICNNSEVVPKDEHLFFINLGGYKPGEFDEFHYKMMVAAKSVSEATIKAKATWFYKEVGFKGATSHIDDKFGVDVDDIFNINDILAESYKSQYQLKLTVSNETKEDKLHIGYLKLEKLLKTEDGKE